MEDEGSRIPESTNMAPRGSQEGPEMTPTRCNGRASPRRPRDDPYEVTPPKRAPR